MKYSLRDMLYGAKRGEWHLGEDVDTHTYASGQHDEGLPFQYRLKRDLAGRWSAESSDAEVRPPGNKTWADLDEAKRAIEDYEHFTVVVTLGAEVPAMVGTMTGMYIYGDKTDDGEGVYFVFDPETSWTPVMVLKDSAVPAAFLCMIHDVVTTPTEENVERLARDAAIQRLTEAAFWRDKLQPPF